MHRIAATLAVVGALLFNAGSDWADYADGMAAAQRGDFATAVQEWRPLAEQGHAGGQNNLGFMYEKGRGVHVNNVRAYAWWSLASVQGHKSAAASLDIVKVQMTPAQIAKAQVLATRMWKKINN